MANPEHLVILEQGIDVWNQWLQDHRAVLPDLSGDDFTEWDLRRADFARANLSGAKLNWAKLFRVDFTRADLSEADLKGADLSWTNLYGADLIAVNLREAFLKSTIFVDVDLSQTKDLETCFHKGPSAIGIDTIYKSTGKIPEVFLRGAGVPEQCITYARSLVGQATEFYSCFISYSSQDQEFAERLNADLRVKNLRVWFAPEDLKIGDRFHERIEESIRLYEKVMIILSEESVQSRWVEREIHAAREREDREKRSVLFPIRIDDAVMEAPQPWAADIRRSRHIGDFRSWKDHDSY